jgi:Ser/Thr protein kinase RdoA (MazF antagonist)
MTAEILTVDTAIPYLIEQHLISADAIVAGDLEIIDAGRRNQSLKILRHNGPSYLVKQPGEGEQTSDATIRCEAWFYCHCRDDPQTAELRAYLPALRGWDEARPLLVLELIDGRPLWAHYAAAPPAEFPSDAAGPFGTALGTLHRVFRHALMRDGTAMIGLPARPPWILTAHRPTPDIFISVSPANLQLLAMIQRSQPLAAGLDRLRREWRAETLIHNDIKGDNVLVTARTGESARVHIIDWELLQIGDAAWDVGSVLRDMLDFWLQSVPLSGDLEPQLMLERAELPLATIGPAARAFWQAYRAAATVNAEAAGDFLLRALRSAAARLAQGAYELSCNRQEPPNLALAMLQLAANIMDDPMDASLHLFGIPVGWRQPGHASRHA